MTVEELRDEAEKLGYKIVKKQSSIRLYPCPICGTKRTIEWTHIDDLGGYTRECECCEFRAERGKTKAKAKENWNKAVSKYRKENNYAV